jgi:hypothetical protein
MKLISWWGGGKIDQPLTSGDKIVEFGIAVSLMYSFLQSSSNSNHYQPFRAWVLFCSHPTILGEESPTQDGDKLE